ncbi:MAG: hypothetical protein KDJ62_08610 [Rhodobiaceae bacterium]|nr:hypothetical protein [Rhodobiaceae bacterium]MCC0050184.1 hypothetical protein [Rhodobiaceae bacterium]
MKFPRWQTVLKIASIIGLLYGASQLTHFIAQTLEFELRPTNEEAVHRAITMTALVYTFLLSLPFVPGAEIGIALLVALGPPIAFLVYLCTVAGLFFSFIVGRFVPVTALRGIAEKLKLTRLANMLKEIEPLDREQRIAYLTRNAPNRLFNGFLRFRYLGLAVLFNLPGNFLIGGGGGIGLLAGLSGLFSFPGYLATVMIAVSPVPLAVAFFGTGFLS